MKLIKSRAKLKKKKNFNGQLRVQMHKSKVKNEYENGAKIWG
jgi:hypothetical protein